MSKQTEVTKNPIRGSVVSVSKDLRTAKVEIPRVVIDSIYGKRLHIHTRVFAHVDSAMSLEVGKKVEVLPCRRISKLKSWKVVSVLN